MEAYCLKCRSKKDMSNTQAITMKNGRPATRGVCPGLLHKDVPDRQNRIVQWFATSQRPLPGLPVGLAHRFLVGFARCGRTGPAYRSRTHLNLADTSFPVLSHRNPIGASEVIRISDTRTERPNDLHRGAVKDFKWLGVTRILERSQV